MRRLALCAASVLFGAACASSDDSSEMEPVFITMQKAVVNGDFEYVYSHTSVAMKSSWLYGIFGSRDQVYAEANRRLAGTRLEKEFDEWYRYNVGMNAADDRPGYRPTYLPDTLLTSAWLKHTLKASFSTAHNWLKHEFNGKSYKRANIEQDRASVLLAGGQDGARAEAYEFAKEDGTWKLNYFKRAPMSR